MKKFKSKKLSTIEAREVQGKGWCRLGHQTGSLKYYPTFTGSCPDAKYTCQDHTGEYDKLENWGFFPSGNGGWLAGCRIKYNYYAFGW